jgi:hypothetical protein
MNQISQFKKSGQNCKILTGISLKLPFLLIILFLSGAAHQAFAVLPPVRNINITSQSSGGNIKYIISVFDDQRGQTMTTDTGFRPSSDISAPVAVDGVVTWLVDLDSSTQTADRSAFYTVYDPRFGNWRTESADIDTLTFRYTPGTLQSDNGLVSWSRNDSTGVPGGSYHVEYHFRAYNPQLGSWQQTGVSNDVQGTTLMVSDFTNRDGFAYWQRVFNNGCGQTRVTIMTLTYDVAVGWRVGDSEHFICPGQFSVNSVSHAGVNYTIAGNSNYWRGYNGDTHNWHSSFPIPMALTYASQSTGNAPLKTYFWDLSIGATAFTYNFGDGGSVSAQTAFYTYNSSANSPYTATQTAIGWGNTRTHSVTITVTTPHSISGTATNASGFKIPNASVTLGGAATRTTQTDANGNYSFTNLTGGGNYTVSISKTAYTFTPSVLSFNNLNGAQTGNFTGKLNDKPSDFDADGKTDFSAFRGNAGLWWINASSNNTTSYTSFGLASDIMTPRDYDGDGKTDIAVWRPSDGTWYMLKSTTGTLSGVQFGVNGDIPVPADYDGDDKTDQAVFRPGNQTWYVLRSSDSQFYGVGFGYGTDKPVPGDYDGDNKADIAVFRPGDTTWYILKSSDSGLIAKQFGSATDNLVPGDYDGDGKTDCAVFDPNTSYWSVSRSSDNVTVNQSWGLSTDKLAPGDFDGDGKHDFAVYRQSAGTWYVLKSSDQQWLTPVLGQSEDLPTQLSYVR